MWADVWLLPLISNKDGQEEPEHLGSRGQAGPGPGSRRIQTDPDGSTTAGPDDEVIQL